MLRRLDTHGPGCLGVCGGEQRAEGGLTHSPSQPCITWGAAWLPQLLRSSGQGEGEASYGPETPLSHHRELLLLT